MLGIECKSYKFEDHVQFLRKIADHSALTNKHSACIIGGDKIISFGYNRCIKTRIKDNQLVKFTIHAEVDALCKIDSRIIKGKDILIIRIGNPRTKKLRNSRPCNECIDKLSRYDIRKVYYSNENGDIVYEFLESMPKLHTSSGNQIRCVLD
jgi:deoxycytidylate deaminase